MSEKLDMPEKIKGNRAAAIRRTHYFDQELFDMANKYRGRFLQHMSWIERAATMEDVIKLTDKSMKDWDDGTAFTYILINDEGQAIGGIEVHSVDNKNFSAEFGYWLNPDDTGKGYVGDTLCHIEKILFDKDMVRLVIRCNVDNLPSNNIALRNNYQLEGTLRKSRYRKGKFLDYNLYAKITPKFE